MQSGSTIKRMSLRVSALLCALTTAMPLLSNRQCLAEIIRLNDREFTIPDDCELTLAASLQLTQRPICADFDEHGRLYVAESSGSNDKVAVQLEQKPHSILRLEDTDGDGVFDQRTVFADRMMFPEGTLWFDGSLYVGAPPQIWKLTDTNDDGVADERSVWFDGQTVNGCANDLHGPYLGPDGWIYWCKGAFEEQTYERPGRDPLVTRAAHIFRRHPSGGPIEAVMTGGMDNPVEVAFSPGGERFFTTTFLQHPRDGLRDGVIHAVYGGVYGKDHGVIIGHPRTGELLPVMTHLGPAAPCGLLRPQTDHIAVDASHCLLVCEFNQHRVSRHVLARHGSTFTTNEVPFLSSPDLDFHPTDVIEDADGSLLIVDTGGWYKLCCPTSQLHKPDIPGAIYRLRRRTVRNVADARHENFDWSSATAQQLAALSVDSRPAVRERAARMLASRHAGSADAVATLKPYLASPDQAVRLQGVWTLTRLAASEARAAVRAALRDDDQTVRNAALQSVSLWRDRDALAEVHRLLLSNNVADRRAAAEATARIGNIDSVPVLLNAAGLGNDRMAEHSITYALIETGSPEVLVPSLVASHPDVQRVALLALDQLATGSMGDALESVGDAIRAAALRLLDTDHGTSTAWWLIERHPEWSEMMADWFAGKLDPAASTPLDAAFVSRLAIFANRPAVQAVMANAMQAGSAEQRIAVLRAMAASRVSAVPSEWSVSLVDVLESDSPRVFEQAVATVRSLAAAGLSNDVLNCAQSAATDSRQPQALRLEALSALAIAREKSGTRLELDDQTLGFACTCLAVQHAPNERALAADVLASITLGSGQVDTAAQALATTGPMELKLLLPVFQRHRNMDTVRSVLAALEQSAVALALDPTELTAWLEKFGPEAVTLGRPLRDRITAENSARLARIDAVLSHLETADERRGQKVFHSTKASCIACHQVGYVGGNIGPSLRRIGNIRSERDLLESVLFPSASFVRSYEPVTVITKQGRVLNGLVRDETPSELVLVLDARNTTTVPIGEIEERLPGTVSIMPAGLDKQFTDQELADLIRFLKVSQ